MIGVLHRDKFVTLMLFFQIWLRWLGQLGKSGKTISCQVGINLSIIINGFSWFQHGLEDHDYGAIWAQVTLWRLHIGTQTTSMGNLIPTKLKWICMTQYGCVAMATTNHASWFPTGNSPRLIFNECLQRHKWFIIGSTDFFSFLRSIVANRRVTEHETLISIFYNQ